MGWNRVNTGDWGLPGTVILTAGGIAHLNGPGRYIIKSNAGAADAMVQITGLNNGDEVILEPYSGHTITVTNDATKLALQGVNFVMNDANDKITLVCRGGNICDEKSRASNG